MENCLPRGYGLALFVQARIACIVLVSCKNLAILHGKCPFSCTYVQEFCKTSKILPRSCSKHGKCPFSCTLRASLARPFELGQDVRHFVQCELPSVGKPIKSIFQFTVLVLNGLKSYVLD